MQNKDLIIFALNSMQDADRAGGSHWSLLGKYFIYGIKLYINFFYLATSVKLLYYTKELKILFNRVRKLYEIFDHPNQFTVEEEISGFILIPVKILTVLRQSHWLIKYLLLQIHLGMKFKIMFKEIKMYNEKKIILFYNIYLKK